MRGLHPIVREALAFATGPDDDRKWAYFCPASAAAAIGREPGPFAAVRLRRRANMATQASATARARALASARRARKAGSLPPGPRTPPLWQALRWATRPIAWLDMCSRRYGDCFTLQLPFFPPEVFFSHPDAIKEIFTGDPDQLLAGQANAPLLGPLVGAGSLLLLDGPRHLRERRLMLPPFHGERMQAYGETMRAIATASIDRWPLGRPISMHQQMVDITFDVILRTVLGFEEGENVARLRAALGRLIRLGQNPVWAWFQVNLSALTRRGRLTRLKALVDQLIFAEIAARRAAPSARSDVVSLLMEARYEDGSAMSDQDLRDEMITLLAAGHETTATALAWAIYHILR